MPKDKEEKANLGGAPKDGIFAASDAKPAVPAAAQDDKVKTELEQLGNIPKKVANKIKACENILIALSNDPNVDEIAAAIGLSMILNKLGKHVTAIYSGETPNTLEFLKPEETFEKDTNSLQDFIIALNKDKADHLRYKIEGDFVKVYITPYKTTITDKDLEFSQGDFNVDLVISIDVDSGDVLDAALSEYGRIMHDATAINITTNGAGHFAELEWSDPSMSSCSEMVVLLAEELGYKEFEQPVATALLTGIVAATDRFSNARTTSDTMALSSKLMQAGADQQLISSNIMKPGDEGETVEPVAEPAEATTEVKDEKREATPAVTAEEPNTDEMIPGDQPLIPEPTLAVPVAPTAPEASENPAPETVAVPETPVATEAPVVPAAVSDTLVLPNTPAAPAVPVAPEMPAANPVPAQTMAPVAPAPAPTQAPTPIPTLVQDPTAVPAQAPVSTPTTPVAAPAPAPAPAPASDTFTLPGQPSRDDVQVAMNEILNPTSTADAIMADRAKTTVPPQIISQGSVIKQNVAEPIAEEPDYGSMIDQALAEALTQNPTANPAMTAAPNVPAAPEAPAIPDLQYIDPNATPAAMMNPTPEMAAASAVPEATQPAVTGVAPAEAPAAVQPQVQSTEINLPPAPTPSVDMANFDIPKD